MRTSRTLLAVVAATLLAGCTSTPETPKVPTRSATPPEVPDETSALTGEDVKERSDDPVLAAKVENSRAARPQTGLEDADVVYEELVEGGQTRFLAVYQSEVPDQIGPIRSVRPMDGPLVAALEPLFAYSGGTAVFVEGLRSHPVTDVGEPSRPGAYTRSAERRAPSNLYLLPEELSELSEDAEVPPRLFRFEEEAEPSPSGAGEPTGAVTLSFSPQTSVRYQWDGRRWERSQNGEAFTTSTGETLAAENVIVQHVEIVPTQYTDVNGVVVPETEVVGAGEAVVLTHGRAVRGTWEKEDAATPTRYRDATGEEIPLAPGSTFVALVPKDRPVQLEPRTP